MTLASCRGKTGAVTGFHIFLFDLGLLSLLPLDRPWAWGAGDIRPGSPTRRETHRRQAACPFSIQAQGGKGCRFPFGNPCLFTTTG